MQGSLLYAANHKESASWLHRSVLLVNQVPQPLAGELLLFGPGRASSFLLRRLHSLSGIVPIGAFLLEHFISNSEASQRGAGL